MKNLQEWIETLDSHEKKRVSFKLRSWPPERLVRLEELLNQISHSGLSDPWRIAESEIEENLPQFGRNLLIQLFKDEINHAPKILEDSLPQELLNKLKTSLTKLEFETIAKVLTSALIYDIACILDGGNDELERDGVGWLIMETNGEGVATNRPLGGLHEDLDPEC
jgi:hypothetical protein